MSLTERKHSYLNYCPLFESVELTSTISRLCHKCERLIDESVFARYPNGVVTHIHCMTDRFICPVTKTDFRKDKKWKLQ